MSIRPCLCVHFLKSYQDSIFKSWSFPGLVVIISDILNQYKNDQSIRKHSIVLVRSVRHNLNANARKIEVLYICAIKQKLVILKWPQIRVFNLGKNEVYRLTRSQKKSRIVFFDFSNLKYLVKIFYTNKIYAFKNIFLISNYI